MLGFLIEFPTWSEKAKELGKADGTTVCLNDYSCMRLELADNKISNYAALSPDR